MIKSFAVYHPTPDLIDVITAGNLLPDNDDTVDNLYENFALREPTGQAWGAIGFTRILGEWAHHCGQKIYLLMVTEAERVCPGSVIKKAVRERQQEIERKEGRKLGRKEIAQIKDDILPDLLQKSHVRLKPVPILVAKDRVLIGTASTRSLDAIAAFLNQAFCDAFGADHRIILTALPKLDTKLALLMSPDYSHDVIDAGNKVTIDCGNRGVMRFADADLHSAEVQQHLHDKWSVKQLAVETKELKVTVTDSGLFRGLRPTNIMTDELRDQIGDDNSEITAATTTGYLIYKAADQLITALTDIDNSDKDDEL